MLLRSRPGSLGSICGPLAVFAGGHGGRIRGGQRLATLGKPVLGSRIDRLQQFLHRRPMDVGQYLNTKLVEQRTELDPRLLGNVAVQPRLLAGVVFFGGNDSRQIEGLHRSQIERHEMAAERRRSDIGHHKGRDAMEMLERLDAVGDRMFLGIVE